MTPHLVQHTDLSPITHHLHTVTQNMSPTWHPILYNTQPAIHNLSLTHCHPRSVTHITPHIVEHKHVTHNQFTHMLSHQTMSLTTHYPTPPHPHKPQTQMSCHVSCPPRACCRSHRVAVWGWCRWWWSHSIAPKPPHWSASGECLASCLVWSTGRLYWTRTMQITNIQIFNGTQRSRRKRLALLIRRSRGLPNRKTKLTTTSTTMKSFLPGWSKICLVRHQWNEQLSSKTKLTSIATRFLPVWSKSCLV